jgi:hypothetical protein
LYFSSIVYCAYLNFSVRLISSRVGTGLALSVLPEPNSSTGQIPCIQKRLVDLKPINNPEGA